MVRSSSTNAWMWFAHLLMRVQEASKVNRSAGNPEFYQSGNERQHPEGSSLQFFFLYCFRTSRKPGLDIAGVLVSETNAMRARWPSSKVRLFVQYDAHYGHDILKGFDNPNALIEYPFSRVSSVRTNLLPERTLRLSGNILQITYRCRYNQRHLYTRIIDR
jgi:hypothetical protein